jgi:transcriptional regulator with XRE-family HTH domain
VSDLKITGSQIRAARAALDWTIAKLKEESGVSAPTIAAIETDETVAPEPSMNLKYRRKVRADSIQRIVAALDKAKVRFLPANAQGHGIRWLGDDASD